MLFTRLVRLVAVLVAGVMALAVAPLSGTPAVGAQEGTPRVPEEFILNMVEGELLIRDAEESFALSNPTSIAGTNETDTGAITDGTFTTPRVTIQQDITSPLPATVFIDADFSLVSPNSVFGTIDHEGQMTVQASLSVDLHIDVQPPGGGDTILDADCTTSPVVLTLESISPYVPGSDGAPGQVTLADSNFSIPELPTSDEQPSCDSLVSGEANNQLAGAGHSLTLVMEGDLTLPPPPGCPTTTSLAASPTDRSELGSPVALTATVAAVADDALCVEAAGNGETPEGGFVDYFDGDDLIGTAPVQAGNAATLTTSALSAGTRDLSAAFRRFGAFEGSTTATPLSYQVIPNPAVTANLPEFLQIGAVEPTEFTVEVANTGFGADFDRVRLDITLQRLGVRGPDLSPDRVVLERRDEVGAWVSVPLTPVGASIVQTLSGSVGEATGFPLPIGGKVSHDMRIRILTTGEPVSDICLASHETCPGPVDVIFELISVDDAGMPDAVPAPAPESIAASSGRTNFIEATRRVPTITVGSASVGPVTPHTVRQGGTLTVGAIALTPIVANFRPMGHLTFAVDGSPIGARWVGQSNRPPDAVPEMRVRMNGTAPSINVLLDLPPTITAGVHQITVRYSGDSRFLPAQFTASVTVVETTGALYDCLSASLVNTRFRAYVEGQANLPSVHPAGAEVSLGSFALRLLFSRDRQSQANTRDRFAPANGTRAVGTNGLAIDLDLGPNGTGTGASLTRAKGTALGLNTMPAPAPLSEVDETIVINNPSGTVTIEGEPGDLVPVTVDRIHMEILSGGFLPIPVTCTPVGAPVLLGEVTASGATLSISPGGPVREGDEVALTAAVEPYTTGQVEFLADGETVGVAAVVDGVARTTTTTLPSGTPNLTAVFTGGLLVPPLVSDPVAIEVIAIDCAPFAEAGAGAVVRLVYMELLRRCPDPEGYAHWKGLLEGGTTQQAFADVISASAEARRQVANDGYQTMFGRDGDPAGLVYWAEFLRTRPYRQMLATMGISDEYWDLSGQTNEGFVTRTYQRVLLREPDEAGLTYWVARLERGESRFVVLDHFNGLIEPTEAIIIRSFNEILDRDPTAEELDEEREIYGRDGNRSALYSRLIGTSEFFDRAQMYPNFVS